MSTLVIVESPAKAKTINKYLGKDFHVLASFGHVRDLLAKEGAVDPERDFAMHYVDVERNKKHIDAIIKAMKQSDALLLATDPDREGEAIAWHIEQILQEKKCLKNKSVGRVVFHQITKGAILEAISQPREICMPLVEAQQARRALDYLVGFKLSPLLWRKIRAGLSAGRVQSPALRMIVERQDAIDAFIPQEYWSISAKHTINNKPFESKLVQLHLDKVEQFTFKDDKTTLSAVDAIKKAANGVFTVAKITKKQRQRSPTAPFITSTLQQEGVRKLHFSTSRVMQIAQQLYEGIDLGDGTTGLITYMRTDSVTLAPEAIIEIRQVIEQIYGKQFLPKETVYYKTKSKNAQEAHEAIRPTSAENHPDKIKSYLTAEQYKLYNLIYKRTIACQMIPATLNLTGVDLDAGGVATFRATGSTLVNPGFMAVYLEGSDDENAGEQDENLLPLMEEGDSVAYQNLEGFQHFTEPLPRFTEASLVKALEEHDIGRPSTYASIIATLKARKYVDIDAKRFCATDVGRIVSKFLSNYFNQIVDYDFTAQLENELDQIALGDANWVTVLAEFWKPFIAKVKETDEGVKRSDVTQELLSEACPTCSKPLSIRLGKRGRFVGCTTYPDCDYTRNLDGQVNEEPKTIEGRQCPKCEHDLVIKHGRYGKFIGCSHYPDCKHMEPFDKPKDSGVTCPECHEATIFERKSRGGKLFYSCHRYPKCKYALWNLPIAEPCPQCDWPILSLKTTKKSGTQVVCPQKGCGFIREPRPEEMLEEDGSE
jgi:DNA topoisomerase-1